MLASMLLVAVIGSPDATCCKPPALVITSAYPYRSAKIDHAFDVLKRAESKTQYHRKPKRLAVIEEPRQVEQRATVVSTQKVGQVVYQVFADGSILKKQPMRDTLGSFRGYRSTAVPPGVVPDGVKVPVIAQPVQNAQPGGIQANPVPSKPVELG